MSDRSVRHQVARLLAVAAAAVLGTALLAPPAGAAPDGAALTGYSPTVATAAVDSLVAGTGLDAAAARNRLAAEAGLVALGERLTADLGTTSGGSWLDADTGALVVGVLDPAAAATVRAAGAEAVVVTHSLAHLNSVISTLDAGVAVSDTSWGVDVAANRVVLTIGPAAPPAAVSALLSSIKTFRDAVVVQRTADSIGVTVSGGEAKFKGGGRCSVGFNVTGGYVLSAGHCTQGGGSWTVSGGGLLGPGVATSFPGDDYGVIRNDGGQPQPGNVTLWNGSFQDITRSGNGSVGQSLCKSGSTTFLTCGTVRATNVTVNYGGQIVNGLVETNVCVDRGDSGGPWFAGSTALGLSSGGNLVCGSGGRSFYQPVTEVLNRYGLAVY